MNKTAGTESRKAAEAVREANKSLIDEMTHSIGEATKRFAEATREMRQASQAMEGDLNHTREELRRGVLQLPEETRESANAMRRVVGDQIKALSELSEIVTRHGKTLDLSSPALGEPRARVVEAATAVSGGRAAPVHEPVALAAAPAPAARVGGEPRRAANSGGAQVAAKAPPPRTAPRPVTARDAGPAGGSREGWVSDLLRRASTDEEPQGSDEVSEKVQPTPVAANGAAAPEPEAASSGPLNALSADIARAIDHAAAVELWERHRKGERNLFTRRLYTLQGQQTFDEIRRKYQRDTEFKSAVDRYVGDFEKLLTEVTRNNKDAAAGNTYLTSDTGKVYTMLAHASGRFD
jgi:hypothetical protein